MTVTRTLNLSAAALIGLLVAATTQAQTVNTRIGKLDFELGVPTKETVTKLYDEMDFPARVPALSLVVPHRRLRQFGGHFERHHRRSPR